MAQPRDAFADWIRAEIAPLVARDGFGRRALRFQKRVGCNWGVIELQRMRSRGDPLVQFTINYGVACDRLDPVGLPPENGPPPVGQCHAGRRIADRNGYDDIWWTLHAARPSSAAVAEEVSRRLAEDVLPWLNTRLTDDGLRDAWLAEWRAGRFVPLMALRPLVEMIGPAELLADLRAAEREQLERLRAPPRPPKLIDIHIGPGGPAIVRADPSDRGSEWPPRVDPFAAPHLTRAQRSPRRRELLLRQLGSKRVTTRRAAAQDAGGFEADEGLVLALRTALSDADPLVRGYAAKSLGHLGDVASLDPILALLATKPRVGVTRLAAAAVLLARWADVERPRVRAALRDLVGAMADHEPVHEIAEWLDPVAGDPFHSGTR